jgi:uncharacterized protein
MKKPLLIIFLLLAATHHSIGQTSFYDRLADSTLTLTEQVVRYDPAYVQLNYPNGDVAPDRGVCTDVVIRAYRKLRIDLQKEVHEDMLANFSVYPKSWGSMKPDKNIDHRRVPNLMTFFSRHGTSLPIGTSADIYLPGDIVCWDLGGGVKHIGMVVKSRSADGGRHMIVHNIGSGQVVEDCLFNFNVIGHYRYGK